MRRTVPALLLFGGAFCLAADQTVTVGPGTSFTPATVMVAPGEKVTWTWTVGGHSSTSDATAGPEVWDSGILAAGQTFSHMFLTTGTHPYYCTVHGAPGGIGMSGSVVVGLPAATPTATPTASPTTTTTPTPTTLATATPTSTAAPGPGGPAGAIPALGLAGRLVLLLGLAAVGILTLFSAAKR